MIVDMASRARRVQRQIERLEEEPAIATEDATLPPIPHVFDTDGKLGSVHRTVWSSATLQPRRSADRENGRRFHTTYVIRDEPMIDSRLTCAACQEDMGDADQRDCASYPAAG